MKLLVFTFWIFVLYVRVKQSEMAPIRVRPERMTPAEVPRVAKREGPKHTGWIWCSDKDENSTFAFKPCAGDPHLEECLKVINESRKDVDKLLHGTWRKARESMKKWALCYLSKNGVMSPEGVLRQDVVLRNIPERDKASVEKTINKCLFKTAHDPMETAWHYIMCFRQKLPKYAKIANHL